MRWDVAADVGYVDGNDLTNNTKCKKIHFSSSYIPFFVFHPFSFLEKLFIFLGDSIFALFSIIKN